VFHNVSEEDESFNPGLKNYGNSIAIAYHDGTLDYFELSLMPAMGKSALRVGNNAG
jgi:hypothetical protein